jgi:hypothetical protein
MKRIFLYGSWWEDSLGLRNVHTGTGLKVQLESGVSLKERQVSNPNLLGRISRRLMARRY